MRAIGRAVIVIPALAVALLTSGCITRDEFEHVRATANTALSTAQQAAATAQQAQQAAAAAQQTADQARADVAALSQRIGTMSMRARGPRD